jgi:heme exporter protein B
MNNLLVLLRKEFTLELRRQSVISGIALYLFSLVFICYLTFNLRSNAINQATWSALFWLVILFSAVNSVAKSFIGEKPGTFIYLYMTTDAHSIIISRIVYNFLLCAVLSLAGYGLFVLFMNDPVLDHPVFLAGLFLTSLGFASSLCLISGIAAKARNSTVVMAVLSFPVIIGILLMATRITNNALDGLESAASKDEILNLLGINLISGALAYLLFPYIWRS